MGHIARKNKYDAWLTEDGLIRIQGWARDGLTDEEIARNIGVSRTTLAAWKTRHDAIATALADGKDVVDRKVENSLLKRALGYSYTERKVEELPSGSIRTTTTTRHVSPDVTAQIFWLKNRKPDVWRAKVDAKWADEKPDDGFIDALGDRVDEIWGEGDGD